MRLTHGLQQAALHHPQRTSTIFEQRRKSYGQTAARVARLAAGLAGLGARPGDRVAILALNSDRYYEAYYAILWTGCVAVPCNTRWSQAEHAAALQDCEPHLLIVDHNFVSAARDFPGIPGERILYMDDGEAPQGLAHFEDLIARSPAMDDNGRGGNDLAGIFYTGGTTGVSKGVMLSHDGLIVNFMASTLLEPYCDDCVFLHSPPMFHLADGFLLFGLTVASATHVIVPRFEPAAVVGAIRDQGINSLLLVPTMIGMLDQHLRETNEPLDTVRRLTYGASPISEALLRRAFVMFPKARICQLYGQTELSPVATLLTSELHTAADCGPGRLRSAGRAIPGVELRIADAQLRVLPCGEVGEILVRGPSVMLGYWRKPALTAETIVDGWLRTGDIFKIDAEGFYYFMGRVDDMFSCGGENVYPKEVENLLLAHPAVRDVCVASVPHGVKGLVPAAAVVLQRGTTVTAEELKAFSLERGPAYAHPRRIMIVDELPLTGAGKPDRKAVQRDLAAYRPTAG